MVLFFCFLYVFVFWTVAKPVSAEVCRFEAHSDKYCSKKRISMNWLWRHFVLDSLSVLASMWAFPQSALQEHTSDIVALSRTQSGTMRHFDDINIVWTSTGPLLGYPGLSIPNVLPLLLPGYWSTLCSSVCCVVCCVSLSLCVGMCINCEDGVLPFVWELGAESLIQLKINRRLGTYCIFHFLFLFSFFTSICNWFNRKPKWKH